MITKRRAMWVGAVFAMLTTVWGIRAHFRSAPQPAISFQTVKVFEDGWYHFKTDDGILVWYLGTLKPAPDPLYDQLFYSFTDDGWFYTTNTDPWLAALELIDAGFVLDGLDNDEVYLAYIDAKGGTVPDGKLIAGLSTWRDLDATAFESVPGDLETYLRGVTWFESGGGLPGPGGSGSCCEWVEIPNCEIICCNAAGEPERSDGKGVPETAPTGGDCELLDHLLCHECVECCQSPQYCCGGTCTSLPYCCNGQPCPYPCCGGQCLPGPVCCRPDNDPAYTCQAGEVCCGTDDCRRPPEESCCNGERCLGVCCFDSTLDRLACKGPGVCCGGDDHGDFCPTGQECCPESAERDCCPQGQECCGTECCFASQSCMACGCCPENHSCCGDECYDPLTETCCADIIYPGRGTCCEEEAATQPFCPGENAVCCASSTQSCCAEGLACCEFGCRDLETEHCCNGEPCSILDDTCCEDGCHSGQGTCCPPAAPGPFCSQGEHCCPAGAGRDCCPSGRDCCGAECCISGVETCCGNSICCDFGSDPCVRTCCENVTTGAIGCNSDDLAMPCSFANVPATIGYCPGPSVTHTIQLCNNGECSETYQITKDAQPPAGFVIALDQSFFTIAAGACVDVPIRIGVNISIDTAITTTLTITADAEGVGDDCGPLSTQTCTASTLVLAMVDLDFGSVPDYKEAGSATAPGGFLCVNDDDDDNNGTPDKDDASPTPGEDDLMPLSIFADGAQAGTLTLSAVAGGNRIKLYESADRSNPVALPKSWDLLGLPKNFATTLYVEGVEASLVTKDVELLLETLHQTGTSCEDRVKITVFTIHPANVDATNPTATKVRYHVDPHGFTLDSAEFTAPGTTDTGVDLPTDFFFTYDQSNLVTGENTIDLSASKSGATCTAEVIATRNLTHAPPSGTLSETALIRIALDQTTAVTIPVLHEMFAKFAFVCYSVPTVPGSKTLWFGEAHVNITTQESSEIPTGIAAWTEILSLRDSSGTLLTQAMIPVTDPTMPSQGPNFQM